MTMTVNPSTAKAGPVTFNVKNSGTIVHEALVLPLPAGVTYDKLEVSTSGDEIDKVSEDGILGDSGEIQPGGTASYTVTLPAGSYAIVCNIAKHYAMGMRAPFTVT